MKTKELVSELRANPEKELLFEYASGQMVGANYHITEVKNVSIDSVDCGGHTDFWKETIIQLWENPLEAGKTKFMTAYKALGILNRVDRMKPIDQEAPVKFEYGNRQFHTAQLPVERISVKGNQLVVSLFTEEATCKAADVCGVEASQTEVTAEAGACSPQQGCCQ